SHPISLRSILLLSNYLRLSLPSGLFPSGFTTNILYAFLFRVQVMKLLIMQFSPASCPSLFGSNILLNTFFSNTLSLCSSLKVRDQISHPYRTIFFPWHYSPSEPRPTSMNSVHFGFSRSYTYGRAPWVGDQLVARPLPVHKHRKTHTYKHQTSML
ncbi:hypothetical protein B7P43_G09339, partial [Cryptotermes secundus]